MVSFRVLIVDRVASRAEFRQELNLIRCFGSIEGRRLVQASKLIKLEDNSATQSTPR
ncbi:hypothetical protein GEV33_004466 [Tenebrio molitor]|jgi:hypothetical protein|uniref:Uncharacterized protein n=1 Tax=Tenebrio molitor TaxID=7067 RepID=A0A8J6HPC9_TENMO|nr:hypothetical protein GEV33_004466 [Tenebrio molitor]